MSGARPFVVGWLTLLLLLGLSVGSAYLAIGGALHAVMNFGIAATQTAIIFILFMKLREPPTLKWAFAAAGFFWLIFMFGLGSIDYVTRHASKLVMSPEPNRSPAELVLRRANGMRRNDARER